MESVERSSGAALRRSQARGRPALPQELEATADGYRFPADSPAGHYWLAHGRGFTLSRDGKTIGLVEDVVYDPLRQRAHRLTVRRRPFGRVRRRLEVSAASVEAVIPSAGVLQLTVTTSVAVAPHPARARSSVAGGKHLARRVADAARHASTVGARTLRHVAAGMRTDAEHVAGWVRREAPHGRAAALVAARRIERGLRSADEATAVAARRAGRALAVAAAAVAHALREASAALAALAAAVWQRAAETLHEQRARRLPASPEHDEPGWHADADTALQRDQPLADEPDEEITEEAPRRAAARAARDAGSRT